MTETIVDWEDDPYETDPQEVTITGRDIGDLLHWSRRAHLDTTRLLLQEGLSDAVRKRAELVLQDAGLLIERLTSIGDMARKQLRVERREQYAAEHRKKET